MAKNNPFQSHLFICTNCGKNTASSPAETGGHKLRLALKDWVNKEHPEWKGKVRINGSGCLDHCDNEIAAVCYPKGVWAVDLKETDTEILKTIVAESMKDSVSGSSDKS